MNLGVTVKTFADRSELYLRGRYVCDTTATVSNGEGKNEIVLSFGKNMEFTVFGGVASGVSARDWYVGSEHFTSLKAALKAYAVV